MRGVVYIWWHLPNVYNVFLYILEESTLKIHDCLSLFVFVTIYLNNKVTVCNTPWTTG